MRFGDCILCNIRCLRQELDLDICPHCWKKINDGHDSTLEQFLKIDFENIPPTNINPNKRVIK